MNRGGGTRGSIEHLLDHKRFGADDENQRPRRHQYARPRQAGEGEILQASKAQAVLGWEPRFELKEGLTRTISYFEKMLSEKGVRDLLIQSPPA
jgi:nucleoside-diphosphate-sugar epimerase